MIEFHILKGIHFDGKFMFFRVVDIEYLKLNKRSIEICSFSFSKYFSLLELEMSSSWTKNCSILYGLLLLRAKCTFLFYIYGDD